MNLGDKNLETRLKAHFWGQIFSLGVMTACISYGSNLKNGRKPSFGPFWAHLTEFWARIFFENHALATLLVNRLS